jgi:uncharacterized protein (DUF305 family)
MYGIMFLNVDEASHIYLSTSRFYMAILMIAAMTSVMMLLMGGMYPNKRLNMAIIISSVVVFVLVTFFLRNQTFVSDRQYTKAMNPHHSSAILNSKHTDIKDPEVKKLAEGIIASQEKEIAKMKKILNEGK